MDKDNSREQKEDVAFSLELAQRVSLPYGVPWASEPDGEVCVRDDGRKSSCRGLGDGGGGCRGDRSKFSKI